MRQGRERMGYGLLAGLSDRDDVQARYERLSTDSSPGRFDVLAGKPPTTTVIVLPEPEAYQQLAERKRRMMTVVVNA